MRDGRGYLLDSECRFPSCTRPQRARGYCAAHYFQWLSGSMRVLRDDTPRRLCSVGGCERLHHATGLCVVHYNVANKRANRLRS